MSVALEAPVTLDEAQYEVIDGQRVEVLPTGARESWLASYLSGLINTFAMSSIGLACTETLFDLQIDLFKQTRPAKTESYIL